MREKKKLDMKSCGFDEQEVMVVDSEGNNDILVKICRSFCLTF